MAISFWPGAVVDTPGQVPPFQTPPSAPLHAGKHTAPCLLHAGKHSSCEQNHAT